MSLFHAWACLLPFAMGVVPPAVAAWRLERREPRLALRDGAISAGALLLLLFVLWIFSGAPIGQVLRAGLFATAFALFVAGGFAMLIGCRARPSAAQVAVGCVVTLLFSTVFLAGPVIEAAPLDAKVPRAELVVVLNPFVVVAGDALHLDVMHDPYLYATHLVDYVRAVPSWHHVAGGYLLAGILLAGIGLGIHRAIRA